jgi:hypothetical protein
MSTSGSDVYERKNFLSPLIPRGGWVAECLPILFLVAMCGSALAHDPYMIVARANLQSNSLELRMTLAGVTVESLLGADDEQVSTADVLSDVEKNRAQLNRCAAGFFQVLAGGRTMVALQTNVLLTSQDHVEFVLIYSRPAERQLRFNAVGFKKLPENEPYGAVLTLTDLTVNRLLGQKLLTATDSSFSAEVSAFADVVDPSATPISDRTPNRTTKPL